MVGYQDKFIHMYLAEEMEVHLPYLELGEILDHHNSVQNW